VFYLKKKIPRIYFNKVRKEIHERRQYNLFIQACSFCFIYFFVLKATPGVGFTAMNKKTETIILEKSLACS
jgi:hypothetical protein